MIPPNLSRIILLCAIGGCITESKAHVVFEEIGTMVGSVSYLHCPVSINVTVLDEMITNATTSLQKWKELMDKLFRWNKWTDGQLGKLKDKEEIYFTHLEEFFKDSLQHLNEKVQQFKRTLPTPSQSSRTVRSVPLEILKAGGQFLGKMISGPNLIISLAQGIFGTFMGLFNMHQLHKLREEISTVHEVQERVIVAMVNHENRIRRVETGIKYLLDKADMDSWLNAPLTVAAMGQIRTEIQDVLHTILHAAQAAQQHRLALDLLSPDELTNLYQSIQTRSELLHYKLLTRMPTDLFQVEVSYLYDGATLMLILHVPMVPKKAALTLHRLHSFPIPFSDQKALLPKPTSSVLAISDDTPRLATTIELVDLMNCHRINSVYVCERHGILSKDPKSTCLGALYENDLELAQQLCELELIPYREHALQLESNWFLIHSPKMYTSFGQCLNGTRISLQIIRGVNKLFIDPACSSDLLTLVLVSDFSLQLDSTMKHFPWSQADLATFGISDDDITATVSDMDNLVREQELLLSEVLAHKKMRARVPWLWIWVIIAALGLLGLLLFFFSAFSTRYLLHLRRRVQLLRQHLGLAPAPQPVNEVELQALHA